MTAERQKKTSSGGAEIVRWLVEVALQEKR
jgi:hypothetical protein